MESNNVKVSVIVATYNQEKYIGHTLESIVTQNVNFKFEALVGEDCSNDGTAKIVKEYAEKYPDIIVPYFREKNLGMYANIPELMTHAKGEYIAFIEGDDYWIDDNKLQKQVDFLDSHPDYVACFGKCIIVDENDVRHPEKEDYNAFKREKGDFTIREFEQYILPGQTATSMYRKVVYGQLQQKLSQLKDATQIMQIDRGQVLCMMAIGKMYNLGEDVAAYRHVTNKESGSWSSQNDYYGIKPVMQYLDGMKQMEKIASVLGLELNFDERRTYELNKLYANMGTFSKEDTDKIRQKIKEDYNTKQKYYKACLKNVFKGWRRT
ncbi:glycosyltransferase [Butyrivibrio sp. INlla16]|uniref:glycosyltransferase family 2 protein n=1 Tax=Butyrivibrio sp. INlla16 TaxID=1520807 RepID=UPI00087E8F9E|nr:glycosyltransferase [Butyrivibrio sp. INlla16]SDB68550.1 Glycosyl transferase family 2 [Butyrivibrio sp. INlla16]